MSKRAPATISIKYPPGVSVGRDRSVRYIRPAKGNKPARDVGVVGHAYCGDAGGRWHPFYRDHALARGWGRVRVRVEGGRDEETVTYRTQREAVRTILQAQGFWEV